MKMDTGTNTMDGERKRVKWVNGGSGSRWSEGEGDFSFKCFIHGGCWIILVCTPVTHCSTFFSEI